MSEESPKVMRGARVRQALARICKEYDLPVSRIYSNHSNTGQKRDYVVTAARWKIVVALRDPEFNLSYAHIGRILNMDHTSCMYAHKRMIETDGKYWDERLERRGPDAIRLMNRRNAKALEGTETHV